MPRITLCTRGNFGRGDVLIADLEELETMDASEIYSKRLNAKERIYFSNRRWTNQKPLGGDQELRTSTLIRPRPIQERVHIDFSWENQKGLFHNLTTHFRLPVKLWTIFGPWSESCIYRHHDEPRVKLYSPREESFPIPHIYWCQTRENASMNY